MTHDTNVLPVESAMLEGSIAIATVALASGTTVLACDYCASAVGCLEWADALAIAVSESPGV